MINFDRILDEVFVGTCPTSPIDVQRLKQAGFTSVLNLQSDTDFRILRINWRKLEDHYLQREIGIYRVPIIDFDDEDMTANLPGAVNALESIISQSKRVLVHCTAGQQRAPSTVIGYLAWKKQYTLDEAIRLVTTARKCDPPIHVLEALDSSLYSD